MKKLLVVAAALLSFSFVNAQVFYLGYQNNTFNSTVGSNTHSETAPGFVVGAGMNFEIADAFGIQPALEMSLNSYKQNGIRDDYKYTNFGIKVPVDLNYGFEISSDFKINVFAGPTFYIGLSNKEKYGDDKLDLYKDMLNRFSFGVDFGAWCDFRDMLRLKIGYDLGMSNIYQRGDSDHKYKQNCLTIAFGYLF